MALSLTQMKVAQMMARGTKDKDIWPALEISETTLYRWKKQDAFKGCLAFFQKEELEKAAAMQAAAGDPDELGQAKADEQEIREQVKLLAANTCKLANKLIQDTIDNGSEELNPRMIPGFVKAATDAIACLRDGNDRITGLEGLLEELGRIEKEIRAKGVEFNNSQAA